MTYWLDDGSQITVSSPPPNGQMVKAILSPNGSAAGYTIITITVDSNQSFTVSNVPEGPYFLQLDDERYELCHGCPGPEPYDHPVEVVFTQLIELRTDSPDLTSVTASRPDIVHPDPYQVQLIYLELSGLAPWVPGDPLTLGSGDSVRTASSQADHYGYFNPTPLPGQGSTTARGTWSNFVGLPDASKHDGRERDTHQIGSAGRRGRRRHSLLAIRGAGPFGSSDGGAERAWRFRQRSGGSALRRVSRQTAVGEHARFQPDQRSGTGD